MRTESTGETRESWFSVCDSRSGWVRGRGGGRKLPFQISQPATAVSIKSQVSAVSTVRFGLGFSAFDTPRSLHDRRQIQLAIGGFDKGFPRFISSGLVSLCASFW